MDCRSAVLIMLGTGGLPLANTPTPPTRLIPHMGTHSTQNSRMCVRCAMFILSRHSLSKMGRRGTQTKRPKEPPENTVRTWGGGNSTPVSQCQPALGRTAARTGPPRGGPAPGQRRGEVVGEEPAPGAALVVVIPHHPDQAQQVVGPRGPARTPRRGPKGDTNAVWGFGGYTMGQIMHC